jgi:hypothetical protein
MRAGAALGIPFFTNGTKYNGHSHKGMTKSNPIEKGCSTIVVRLAGSSKP